MPEVKAKLKNRILSWYLRLLPGDRLVVKTVALLMGGELFFTALYLVVPPEWQAMVLFQGVLWSETTSIGALYYALKVAREYYNAEARLKMRLGDAKELVGTSFVDSLVAVGKKLENKYRSLTPEQKEKLAKLLDRGVDFGFDRLAGLIEGQPKRRPKRINVQTAKVPPKRKKLKGKAK